MARVVLYTQAGCSYSDRLRERLGREGHEVEEVDLTVSPQAITELLKLTDGKRVLPVVVQGARIEIAPDGGTEF